MLYEKKDSTYPACLPESSVRAAFVPAPFGDQQPRKGYKFVKTDNKNVYIPKLSDLSQENILKHQNKKYNKIIIYI